MTDQPLAHLTRRTPPWRDPVKTECGRDLADVARHIERDDAQKLIARHGQQRAAFMLCMTCVNTSDRYADWTVSPSSVVGRDGYSTLGGQGMSQMDRELFAIAALVAAHRDEFDAYLTDLDATVSLAERRAQQRKQGGR
jgi:hypothetical protein